MFFVALLFFSLERERGERGRENHRDWRPMCNEKRTVMIASHVVTPKKGDTDTWELTKHKS